MMQLEKIVAYHKALADPTRLRMLLLLAQGELHGQALAERLNLSQPTVTHHASKLREAALIKERRERIQCISHSILRLSARMHRLRLILSLIERRLRI